MSVPVPVPAAPRNATALAVPALRGDAGAMTVTLITGANKRLGRAHRLRRRCWVDDVAACFTVRGGLIGDADTPHYPAMFVCLARLGPQSPRPQTQPPKET